MKKLTLALAACIIISALAVRSNTVTFGELAGKTYIITKTARIYTTSDKALQKLDSAGTMFPGSYRIVKKDEGMLLLSEGEDKGEFWVNPTETQGKHGSSESTD